MRRGEVARGNFIRRIRHRDRTRDFRSAATVNNAIVADQIAHHTHGVVKRSFGFVDNHLVATADENGDSFRVGTPLNHHHAVFGGAERQFTNATSMPQLCRGEILEARNNAAFGGDGNQLRSR